MAWGIFDYGSSMFDIEIPMSLACYALVQGMHAVYSCS